jgi:hypothetical protein
MNNNLSKQQFGPMYHGTMHKFKKGDIIRPAAQLNQESNWGYAPHSSAFATEHLGTAKFFANSSYIKESSPSFEESQNMSVKEFISKLPKSKPRIDRVYEVEPLGPTKLKNLSKSRAKNAEAIVEHSSTEGFKVKKQVWRKPRTDNDVPRPKGLN